MGAQVGTVLSGWETLQIYARCHCTSGYWAEGLPFRLQSLAISTLIFSPIQRCSRAYPMCFPLYTLQAGSPRGGPPDARPVCAARVGGIWLATHGAGGTALCAGSRCKAVCKRSELLVFFRADLLVLGDSPWMSGCRGRGLLMPRQWIGTPSPCRELTCSSLEPFP